MATHTTRVLLIYPHFVAPSFWNYRAACEVMGSRYPAPPLGLITVAAMLPQNWSLRLIDCNTETLTNADIDSADLVLVSAMLPQQYDALGIIDLCRECGVPVAIGGPDLTSSPHVYERADFQVRGEAESVIADFVAAWERGERRGVFEAEKFKADVTSTPIPRFDLLRLKSYLHIGVQFSRGCPFTCEFCDIIELYGRVPRTKTTPQMLAELDALFATGYRGHVDFVDDNLIGNKKAIKAFLPFLRTWQVEHEFPFEFSTEASINLADDAELLRMMREANFFALFVGIESTDTETLRGAQKKQNTRRDLTESVRKIYAAGIFVVAGFIIGFDQERESIAQPMMDAIEAMAIPVAMVGLLYALPNTQLTRRLAREQRLHTGFDRLNPLKGDQCTAGLNFETVRERRAILSDYADVVERLYAPDAYLERVRCVGRALHRPLQPGAAFTPRARAEMRLLVRTAARVAIRRPDLMLRFWRVFRDCAKHNPGALNSVVSMMVLYLHFGPFAKTVAAQVRAQIAALDAGEWIAPPLAPADVEGHGGAPAATPAHAGGIALTA